MRKLKRKLKVNSKSGGQGIVCPGFFLLTKKEKENKMSLDARKLPLPHPPVSVEINMSGVVKVLEGGMKMMKKIFKHCKTFFKTLGIAFSLNIGVINIPLVPAIIT